MEWVHGWGCRRPGGRGALERGGGGCVRGESGTRCANMERRLGFLEGLILQWMNVGESPIRAPEGAA